MKKRIVIFASGSGTNTENIIKHFKQSTIAEVVLVLSNKKDAAVLQKAKKHNIKSLYFDREMLSSEKGVLKILQACNPDLIVLAGFLWKFPELILRSFPNKVINIHPALLPKYGGKGMYGTYVHEAIIANNEPKTGITIHYVNENYDEGAIIFQEKVALSENETPESVAKKVHQLEYKHFPKVIEQLLEA
ncbi:phosphoribosylglycinamide formyltransferase [Marixanthomonas sp. SCSIO 43207]|uniref:phosphoribosylglycinamide formyltransferase n=1 Tax=Marixanthomonas sp. SCSIO 43207 TaxID=2779360 RepID=UPI001CA888F0|nr:phosphoribosylglycinamide formyltransferase [Marixanthomonas sp. SCSIO 43207]UAB82025.1 phosphoribosylglycinamide formyltransferase [Marixanthomonas sp. SCSIO 43207]